MRYIRLQHEVVHAQYDTPTGKWLVRVRRPNAETGVMEEFEDSGDVLVTAVGALSRWKWPEIEGLREFKGELQHSAGFEPGPKTWEEVAAGWADKTVGVIGVVRSSPLLLLSSSTRADNGVHRGPAGYRWSRLYSRR